MLYALQVAWLAAVIYPLYWFATRDVPGNDGTERKGRR